MAETVLHRNLIRNMHGWVAEHYPNYRIVVDIAYQPGDEVPPKIGKHRPDLLAEDQKRRDAIIGEAKTRGGSFLWNDHTKSQIRDFCMWLSHKNVGLFIFSIPYAFLDETFRLLWLSWKDLGCHKVKILIVAECDLWHSDFERGDNQWRLH